MLKTHSYLGIFPWSWSPPTLLSSACLPAPHTFPFLPKLSTSNICSTMNVTSWNQNWENFSVQFSSVQPLSHVQLFAIPWIAASQASLSITNSRNSLKLTSIESVMPFSHLILFRSPFLSPTIPPSIRVFSNESSSHQVAKVLEFQLQHQSFQWTPRTDLL